MVDAPKSPTWRISTKQRSRARSLRRNTADAERIICNAVRAHRMHGASFRRQTPIGPYIVDFVCHEAKLVIEIDGGQHFETEQMKRDTRRDAFLASTSPPLPSRRGREQTEPVALLKQQSLQRARP